MLKYCLSILLYLFAYNHGVCVNFNEMAQGWRKFHGDKFVFESIEKRGDDFVKQIDKFGSKVDDALDFTTDIKLKPDAIHLNGLNLEYKSWKKNTFDRLMKGDQFKNQLKNYIKNDDFEYVIDKKKLLNDGVLDPDKFVKGEFQKVFKQNNYELFEEFFNAPQIKTTLFNGMTKSEAMTYFRYIVDNVDESLYKFIKIE